VHGVWSPGGPRDRGKMRDACRRWVRPQAQFYRASGCSVCSATRRRYARMRYWRGPLLGVTVTTERADDAAGLSDHGVESIDEQARRKGIRPIASADDLAQDGVFDTDEELYAFLAHVAAMRHADLA
jgi:hypothetical protein